MSGTFRKRLDPERNYRWRDDIVDPGVLGRRRLWRDAWRVTERLTRYAVRWTGVAMTTEVTVMASSAVMLTRPELNVCKRRNSAFRPTRWRWRRPPVVRRTARHCSWTHPRRPATGLIDMHVGWLDTTWDLYIYALRWTGVTKSCNVRQSIRRWRRRCLTFGIRNPTTTDATA